MSASDETNLPDYAEETFSQLCSAVGAIAHPPKRDRNGWDFLVEFMPVNDLRPVDLHDPILKVWVQVKSSQSDGRECRVSLSNLLKSAHSHDPWFIVSLAKDTSGKNIFYAKHVWLDLIERALREARQSSISGRALNKRELTLKFSDDDAKTEADLLRWMRGCVEAIPNYDQADLYVDRVRRRSGRWDD